MTTTVFHRFVGVGALGAWITMALPVIASPADPAPSSGIPQSAYNNSNKKPDPFLPPKLKASGGVVSDVFDSGEFQLQGIIWHPTKPAAVVNRKRIELNQTIIFALNNGERSVKAIAIDRNRVVLQAGEQKFELRLER